MLMTAGRENVWVGAQNMDQQSITDFVWLGGAMGNFYIFPYNEVSGSLSVYYKGTDMVLL